MSVTQCSFCDQVGDYLAAIPDQSLDDCASVLGVSAPQLLNHLDKHGQTRWKRRLLDGPAQTGGVEDTPTAQTPGGVTPPASVEETAAAETPDPSAHRLGEVDCACDRWAFQPDEPPHHEADVDGVTWLHTPAWCGPVEEPEEPLEVVVVDEDEVVDARIGPSDVEVLEVLEWLAGHADEQIRAAATDLTRMLAEFEQHAAIRQELERLTVEREHLTARIDKLLDALGEPAPVAESAGALVREVLSTPATVRTANAAEIRAWCREHGVPCPATGRVPRSAIDAYDAAHDGVAS
jgi:hypothetical protein